MFKFIYSNLKKGIEKVINNPQLVYTIIVALVIVGSFVFVSEKFITIANSAQERLINVRIGSLQDAFVSFAGDKINDGDYLNKKISEIITKNETIKNFKIVVKKNTAPSEALPNNRNVYTIIASNDSKEINTEDNTDSFLYILASGDANNSITIADTQNGERFFKTVRAITDDNGNVLGVVVTTQTLSIADIAIEESISNSRTMLLVVIIIILLLFLRLSKIIDYMELYKKLKEVDELKDDFVSMASHELRTPLAIIRGYSEFIREAPELSAETKDFTSKIDMSVRDLDSLVSDILDVSRINQGRMSFKFEKINPVNLLEDVSTSLSMSAKDKGLNLIFDKNVAEEGYINVDIDRLKQVLINLIGNAIKYTKTGEVKITQYKEKGFLNIQISDTGIGMSEEERTKLFEKFYRIRNKETKEIRGTGLGLWITSKILSEMKGKISVESIKGVGSHFTISFPFIKN